MTRMSKNGGYTQTEIRGVGVTTTEGSPVILKNVLLSVFES